MDNEGLNNHPPQIIRMKRFNQSMKPVWPLNDADETIKSNFLVERHKNMNTSEQDEESETWRKVSEENNSSVTKEKSSLETRKSSRIKTKANQIIHDPNEGRIRQLIEHLPRWGGIITSIPLSSRSFELKGYQVTNTCTIDYLLLAIWFSSKLSTFILNSLETLLNINEDNMNGFVYLQSVINYIDEMKWDHARTLWVLEVNQIRTRSVFSTFGTEDKFLFTHLIGSQFMERNRKCTNSSCLFIEKTKLFDLAFMRDESRPISLSIFSDEICKKCHSNVETSHRFLYDSPFLFVTINQKEGDMNFKLEDLPKIINIDNREFTFLCGTFNVGNHFKAIFLVNNQEICVDDLVQVKSYSPPPQDYTFSTCYYYRNK